MPSLSTPQTRRAWQYVTAKGGLESNLKLNTVALPPRKPREHLIKIVATSLNPVDYKMAEIPFLGNLLARRPAIPCYDIAGLLVQPADNSPLEPGQLVFGAASTQPIAAGGLAEYAVTPSDLVVAVPQGVEPAHAATIPVAGLTAYQSIAPYVKAGAGERVFINGGSGGVGVFAVQIAKALGCHVTTTCSGKNVEFVKSLGADEVLDYTSVDVIAALKEREKFALVMENVGRDDDMYWRCHEFTTPGAKFVNVGREVEWASVVFVVKASLLPGFLGGGKRPLIMFFPKRKPEDLEQVAKWIGEGKVKVPIDSRFSFEDAPDAFRKLKTGRTRGKIIVDVAPADA